MKRKTRECRVALRPHRPRSPPHDPGGPTSARWRLCETASHPLTGASRPHARVRPQSCTCSCAHAHLGRTHMHNSLHTARPHTCTRKQRQSLRSRSKVNLRATRSERGPARARCVRCRIYRKSPSIQRHLPEIAEHPPRDSESNAWFKHTSIL